MLHPYNHELLHKNQHRELVKKTEYDRLVRLVSRPTFRLWRTHDFKQFVVKWWTQRRQSAGQSRLAGNKIVMPEA